MSHLVLELRPGEMMVVNGATIRFRNKCRVELVSQARFLFGKQIMAEHEAATLTRQLYFHLQGAYVGDAESRRHASGRVDAILASLRDEPGGADPRSLSAIADAVASDDFYKALKLTRAMIRSENADPDVVAMVS